MSEMDKRDVAKPPFKVGIYPVPGFAMMSYACTVEPLRAANLLARRTVYDVVHFARTEVAQSSGQAQVTADHRVGEVLDLDLLLVISGGDPMAFDDRATLRWLGRMARRCRQMGGVSGGPVLLVKAGLMDGRRMTVHWEHAAALGEAWPGLLIERRLYVIDRDRVTCGGGTAPLDLIHALIAEHHGGGFARLVSDWFLHTDVRAAADPQRAGLVERLGTHAAPVLDTVAVMEGHVGDPLSLVQLALLAGVSPRQLNRLFTQELGISTMRYYRQLRLETARRLIDGSHLSVTEVALATGFSDSAHFSHQFSRHYGIAPSASRRGLARSGR